MTRTLSQRTRGTRVPTKPAILNVISDARDARPYQPLLFGGGVWYNGGMLHRHIIEAEKPSLAAIDDIIDRGGVMAWRELKAKVDADLTLAEKILRVCAAKISDPYAQRYHLWNYYAKRVIA